MTNRRLIASELTALVVLVLKQLKMLLLKCSGGAFDGIRADTPRPIDADNTDRFEYVRTRTFFFFRLL